MVPRRALLRALGITVTAGIAGCNALSGEDPGDTSTQDQDQPSTPTTRPTETLTPDTPVSRTANPPPSPETPPATDTDASPDTPVPTVSEAARTQALTQTADSSVTEFGRAVALSEDVAVVVAEQEGAFVFEGDGWRETAALVPEDLDEFDGFDASAAVNSERVVISGPNANTDAGKGGAYLFEQVDGEWTQRYQFAPEEPEERNQFGRAVAFDGSRVVVGDVNDPGTMVTLTGGAYVFVGTGTTWRQETSLGTDAPDLFGTDAPDLFGTAVAVDGATLLIGAPLAEFDGNETGAVHVYEYADDGWQRQTVLTPADSPDVELFGQSVAINDTTAVVGAPGAEDGAVFVFERGADGWVQQASVPGPGLESGAEFGRAVALSGDSALVGAPMAHEVGRAYTLRAADDWTLTQQLAGKSLPDAAEFGAAVALSGATALVGAPAFRATTGAFLFDV